QFALLMHKQHPQTAYRKYAILIGTISKNCDTRSNHHEKTSSRISAGAQHRGVDAGCAGVGCGQ
ncbi:hypothetical protein, partial [Faecalibacterium butyricigenerans]|uniref:hypothetical protein n=1 Tax=Faecalibacterium butyricigenerans TaxID=1851427 RepID=UPI0032C1E2C8